MSVLELRKTCEARLISPWCIDNPAAAETPLGSISIVLLVCFLYAKGSISPMALAAIVTVCLSAQSLVVGVSH